MFKLCDQSNIGQFYSAVLETNAFEMDRAKGRRNVVRPKSTNVLMEFRNLVASSIEAFKIAVENFEKGLEFVSKHFNQVTCVCQENSSHIFGLVKECPQEKLIKIYTLQSSDDLVPRKDYSGV